MVFGLKREIAADALFPMMFCSASHNIAGHALLETFVDLLPGADVRGSIKGKAGAKDVEFECKDVAFPSALIFKTISDPFSGQISLFRVFSGTIKSDTVYWNTKRDHEERVGKLQMVQGKQLTHVPELRAGISVQ